MHKVVVRNINASCSCGWSVINAQEGEVLRLGYIHARKNTPSIVQDRRLCSDKCDLTGVSDIHHEECFHYVTPTVPKEF